MIKALSSLVFLWAIFSSSAPYAQDVSGIYTLSVSQNPGADDCVWAGDLELVQSSGNPGPFSGTASLSPVSGPCPGFSGGITGTINGSALTIGVGVSGLGTATFSGSVTGPGSLGGTWSGLGLTGIWSAVLAATPMGAAAIPTLPQWALLLLIALIVGFAFRYSQRRAA